MAHLIKRSEGIENEGSISTINTSVFVRRPLCCNFLKFRDEHGLNKGKTLRRYVEP
jgi:hypothetical protein